MKTNIIIIIFIMIFLSSLNGQTIDWSWLETTGSIYLDYGKSIEVTDDAIYVYGAFYQTTPFGSIELTSNGQQDIFVGKMDLLGNWIWAVSAGGTYDDKPYDITIDDDHNIYIIGYFYESIDFGSDHLESQDSKDIFITKLDNNGNWIWAVSAGGEGNDIGESIAVDSENDVYITGSFWETISFGDTNFISSGADDFFVSKLNSSGEWIWAQHGSGQFNDSGSAVDISNNNIFITGGFNGPTSFGPITLNGDGWDDIFVIKLDQEGEIQLYNEIESSTQSMAYSSSIFCSFDGSIILTGKFNESLYFGDPQLTLSTNGDYDTFVVKLNEAFICEWSASAGGAGEDYGNSLSCDSAGNVWITGIFSEAAEFGNLQLVSNGNEDIFVSMLNNYGEWILAEKAGGLGEDISYGIDLNADNEIVLTGSFKETATFGPLSATSNGNSDLFVCMINQLTSINENLVNPSFNLINFPNPFNPSTTISFNLLPSYDSASIEIYNIKGQRVKTFCHAELVEACGTINNYSVVWNGTDEDKNPVSSGIYFARFKTGNEEASCKMLLLK
ncbi:MAG: T9SS type A sorting domain-containing protein [Candidatus Cloacimonetes bacterium]|nr:T9SS type A sorting domain-containing protein [Candidatus Cloacimonadota bacterium]MCF7814563.1 T9SS type A sorting domain-containing protein [Candidatus Cloacimonadota bacterium]MCF7867771.1 T9SS type A sorting domain-containing protein [Candidatus Cloacimonadota bacterium]MCF7883251.1 T9SS type A sorting domain-containing protein [Candidatus Cloacimonadota bacterium]